MHHVAQKFSTTILPRYSARLCSAPATSRNFRLASWAVALATSARMITNRSSRIVIEPLRHRFNRYSRRKRPLHFAQAYQRKRKNVNVADRRQDERMVNSDAVGQDSLELRNNGAANDRGDQYTRAFSGQRPQAFNAQREDAGE